MKYTLLIFAIFGIIVSSLALREHYREYGDSPCSINAHWDCGVVNHSPYAMLPNHADDWPLHFQIPVAVVGILGYILMAILALSRSYRFLLACALGGLGFSLYLAHIEKDILGEWCIYCVISLGIVSVMTLLTLGTVIAKTMRRTPLEEKVPSR
ncbi:MAG TPA: vitamin K epoxide reductase family protein [Verrucomicrobiae bacterium]|jgi:vitamin-K-epoxide reductase (warfarin-sensitive)|nr:vitamin K epoxide reductase family protein [Verrucomicrobiae bacterium]